MSMLTRRRDWGLFQPKILDSGRGRVVVTTDGSEHLEPLPLPTLRPYRINGGRGLDMEGLRSKSPNKPTSQIHRNLKPHSP